MRILTSLLELQVLILWMGTCRLAHAYSYPTKGPDYTMLYMDRMCGGEIDMYHYNAIKVRLTEKSGYPSNLDCWLTIKGRTDKHLLLKFEALNINSGPGCTGLEVFSGYTTSKSRIGGPYCTHYSNPKSIRPLTSGASTLSLHFKGDKYSGASFGFEIIVTAIRIGVKCNSDEFSCGDDSPERCIASSLKCDGYDNCGDMADENYKTAYCGGLSPGAIAGVVVGCVALLVIIVVVVVIKRKRAKK